MSNFPHVNLNAPHYILPHNRIMKEISTTNKLRAVFDEVGRPITESL